MVHGCDGWDVSAGSVGEILGQDEVGTCGGLPGGGGGAGGGGGGIPWSLKYLSHCAWEWACCCWDDSTMVASTPRRVTSAERQALWAHAVEPVASAAAVMSSA